MSFGSDQFADLAKEILDTGRSLRFRARGLSMRPTIRDGDLLEIRPVITSAETCFGEIRLGDILLYQNFGQAVNSFPAERRQLLVHRVIRKKKGEHGQMLLIQGDAVLQPDGWVHPRQVLGRVSQVERPGAKSVSAAIRLDTPLQQMWALILALSLPVQKRIYIRSKRLLRRIF